MPDSRAIGGIFNESNPKVNSGKNYLLAIGIDKYKDERIDNLKNAVNDTKHIAELLVNKFGFENCPEYLFFDEKATKRDINAAIRSLITLFNKNPEQHNLIFYFAGHGHYDNLSSLGYRLPHEAELNYDETYIDDSFILDRIKSIKAKHFLLISDSCFSGSMIRSVEIEPTPFEDIADKLVSRHIITAGLLKTVSDGLRDSHSPFAKALITYLEATDKPIIPFSDVAQHIKHNVPKNAKDQTPYYGILLDSGDYGGEFILHTKNINEEKQAYERAVATPSIYNLNKFLDDYPNSIYTKEIENLLQEVEERNAFEEVKNFRTTSACRNFVKKFPQSKFISDVNKIKEEILSNERNEREQQDREYIELDKLEREQSVKIELAKQEKKAKSEQLKREKLEREQLAKIELAKQEKARFEKLELENQEHVRLERIEREKHESKGFSKIISDIFIKKSDTENIQIFEPEMVLIKGGTFKMGDVMGDNEKEDEKPVHTVTLDSFNLGIYEITLAQFKAFIDDLNYKTDADKEGTSRVFTPKSGKWDDKKGVNWKCNTLGSIRTQKEYSHPVINVSWNDAVAFCIWLSHKTGKKYRLPTEAEWEYAAREGGKKVRFGNGKDIANTSELNFAGLKEYKKPYSVVGEYREKTTEVGSFKPNSLGLFDMSGNVYDWCEDDWHDNYKSAPVNGRAWIDSPRGASRVMRGGSWFIMPHYCRAALRNYGVPTYRNTGVGFRVASSLQ